MTEDFPLFIWQQGRFEHRDLRLTDGRLLQIRHPGYRNENSGPDFSDSDLEIEGIRWYGATEIHVKTSDWHRHKHSENPAFDRTVLHVVWQDDLPENPPRRNDGSPIPVLALIDKTEEGLLARFADLQTGSGPIPCAELLETVRRPVLISTIERMFFNRLERKAEVPAGFYAETGKDAEETAYRMMAYGFGLKVNAEAFAELGRILPLKILRKHADSVAQTEALLFGTAGLLPENPPDDYSALLVREYAFLSAKYELQSKQMRPDVWKFARMRPAGFPTLRLAAFADLLRRQPAFFRLLTESDSLKELQKILSKIRPSEYWQTHYHFGKKSKSQSRSAGKEFVDNLLINSVLPLLIAFGKIGEKQKFTDRALLFAQQLPAEKHKISRMWEGLNLDTKTAADTQAQVELYKEYCQRKRCLSCGIGLSILRKKR